MSIENVSIPPRWVFDDWLFDPEGEPRTPTYCWILQMTCQRSSDKKHFYVRLELPESIIGRDDQYKIQELQTLLQNALLSLQQYAEQGTEAMK